MSDAQASLASQGVRPSIRVYSLDGGRLGEIVQVMNDRFRFNHGIPVEVSREMILTYPTPDQDYVVIDVALTELTVRVRDFYLPLTNR